MSTRRSCRGRKVAREGAAIVMALCTALPLVAPSPARGGEEAVGTTAAAFLSAGSGAGVLGRGGATLGLTGDLGVVSWNPAVLGWLPEMQIAIAHAGLEDEARQEWIAVGGRLAHSALRWSLDGLYQSEGSFEGRDALNNPTGDFEVSGLAVALHVAHPLGELATVGVGGKYVADRLGTVTGSGFTMDAGVQLRAGIVGAGVAVTNVGGSMSYGGARYGMPTNVGVGAALDLPLTGLRLALDLNLPRAYYRDVRLGAEWRWRELLALRVGYRRELDAPPDLAQTGPSFGVGAGVRGVWLDYGYLVPGAGEGQHRLAVTLRPGRFGWLRGDPFGQRDMRRDFDDARPGLPPGTSPRDEDGAAAQPLRHGAD